MEIAILTVGPVQTNCYIVNKEGSSSCIVIDPGEEAEKIAAVTPEQIQAAAGKLELKAVYVLTGKEEGERE